MEDRRDSIDRVSSQIKFIQWMFGGFFLITIAAIPWAMKIQSDVAAMQAILAEMKAPPDWFKDIVAANTKRIESLEIENRDLHRKLTELTRGRP